MQIIEPGWPAPVRVRGFSTTRSGGTSRGAYASLNLGMNSNDEAAAVAANRQQLSGRLPAPPRWLHQVHGTRVIHLADWHAGIQADAAWTDRPDEVLAILSADCLPILLANAAGSFVAAIHGGWRSLAGGIVEAVLAALPAGKNDMMAWLGPGICARCYQVGSDVRAAFLQTNPDLERFFLPDAGRWRLDLKGVAAFELMRCGIRVFDSRHCTVEEPGRFFSYRRDGQTGRLATLAWIDSGAG